MQTNRLLILHPGSRNGTLTKAEKEEFELLLSASDENRKLAAELDKIWEGANLIEGPDTDASWIALESIIKGSSQTRKISLNAIPKWIYAAALFAVIVGGILFLKPDISGQSTAYSTGKGQIKEVDLPDGSHVTLNENSKIEFHSDAASRKMNFTGDAYFTIAKDPSKPFTILGNETVTRILGTRFHLFDAKGSSISLLEVTEGKVSFKGKAGNEAFVTAGKKAVIQKNQVIVSELESEFRVEDWKKGNLVFDNNSTLAEVTSLLSARYNVSFEFANQNLETLTFRGTITPDDSLDQVLELIAISADISYTKNGNRITLSGKGVK